MKKFIEEAETTKVILEQKEEEVVFLSSSLLKEEKKVASLQEDLSTHEDLRELLEVQELQEEALRVKEQSLDYLILEVKLECAEQRNKELFSLVEKVFGHPSVTISKNSNIPIAVDGGGQYAGYVQREGVDEITTTTEGKV